MTVRRLGIGKHLIWGAIGIVVLLLTGGTLVYRSMFYYNYPDKEKYPVRGISIYHQTPIEWDSLEKNNVNFVFIKATEGSRIRNPNFHDYWGKAKSQGVMVGASHFYRLCENGLEQANHFIQIVPKESDALPPVLDLGFRTNCQLGLSPEEQLPAIQSCLNRLEEHYGKRPILYTSRKFYNTFIIGRFKEYPIGIKDSNREPLLEQKRQWAFWQYDLSGHLSRKSTSMGLDVFSGTKRELMNLRGNTPHITDN